MRVQPDDGWVPGSYLLKLTSSDGGQSQVPLVIRDDDRPAPVHIQHDVTTWQAYNKWGGASLYEGDNGRSTKVTFDRPYYLSGSGNFLGGVHEISQLVESLGVRGDLLDEPGHPCPPRADPRSQGVDLAGARRVLVAARCATGWRPPTTTV